jgi:predicted DNA-binding transcriptional regulator YafY
LKLVALFDPSVKYHLIETYGPHCYTETDNGLLFELGFANRDFLIGWLLGFGDKVKVLEPVDVVIDIKTAAEKILSKYK